MLAQADSEQKEAVADHGEDWRARCHARRLKQRQEIPKDWLLDISHYHRKNVIDVPRTCGLLNERELEITETTDLHIMLERLASGSWSSVEVTTAFYKRAIIAHQLVKEKLLLYRRLSDFLSSDQLPHGDFRPKSIRSRTRGR